MAGRKVPRRWWGTVVARQNTKFLAISPQEAVDFSAVHILRSDLPFTSKLDAFSLLDDFSFRIRRRYNPNWT